MRPLAPIAVLCAALVVGCSSSSAGSTTAARAPAPQAAPTARPAAAKPVVTVTRLPATVRRELRAHHFWRPACPVRMSGLRVLTVPYWGFDRHVHAGQLVVNARAAHPLGRVFRRLYRIRFPIRHMTIEEAYVRAPKDGDPTASFDCRQAVPSPCTGGKGTGTWSMHAYGLAVDLNPRENPYVGCGQSRDPTARSYRDRSRRRRGMVGRRAVAAFASIGWGWGGSWSGNTKDYMHFSSTGH